MRPRTPYILGQNSIAQDVPRLLRRQIRRGSGVGFALPLGFYSKSCVLPETYKPGI